MDGVHWLDMVKRAECKNKCLVFLQGTSWGGQGLGLPV